MRQLLTDVAKQTVNVNCDIQYLSVIIMNSHDCNLLQPVELRIKHCVLLKKTLKQLTSWARSQNRFSFEV